MTPASLDELLKEWEMEARKCLRIIDIYPKAEDGVSDQSQLGTVRFYANRTLALIAVVRKQREILSEVERRWVNDFGDSMLDVLGYREAVTEAERILKG